MWYGIKREDQPNPPRWTYYTDWCKDAMKKYGGGCAFPKMNGKEYFLHDNINCIHYLLNMYSINYPAIEYWIEEYDYKV